MLRAPWTVPAPRRAIGGDSVAANPSPTRAADPELAEAAHVEGSPSGGPATRPPIEIRGSRGRTAAAQLELGLAGELPRLPIEPDWKASPRLWGHAFHPMCSYLASFPAPLAHAFIARYSRPGDVVLDPFAGRGTVPLQACVEGRLGVGNDLNPFAHVLTAAKVDPPTRGEAAARLARLRIEWSFDAAEWNALGALLSAAAGHAMADRGTGTSGGGHALPVAGIAVPGAGSGASVRDGDEAVPLEVALAYHPRTLGQLLFIRSRLDLADRADRFLAAAVAGILHGKSRSYLTDLMPNTFSMAPRYVRDFALRTGFAGPERDVFTCLGEKLGRLDRDGRPASRGLALLGDARDAGARARVALRERALPERARLVVTSPPYLRVLKYGYYNWLRAWFLGFDAAEIDRTLDDAHRREPYLAFLRETFAGLRPALADDAVVVVVIGDVEADRGKRIGDGIGLADAAWRAAAEPEGYRLAGIVLDPVAAPRKMTKLWRDAAGQATKTDRILVMGATETGRRRALAGAGMPVRWDGPGDGASGTLRT
jgi:site-specific DNA-methyltransferase (adenine-specific)